MPAQKKKASQTDLGDQIKMGFALAFERLVKDHAMRNERLVFAKDGQIVYMNAKDVLKQMKRK